MTPSHATVAEGIVVPCEAGQEGEINITGIVTDHFIAGRVEICDGIEWRAVYHNQGLRWLSEAKLICASKDFPEEGKTVRHLTSNISITI